MWVRICVRCAWDAKREAGTCDGAHFQCTDPQIHKKTQWRTHLVSQLTEVNTAGCVARLLREQQFHSGVQKRKPNLNQYQAQVPFTPVFSVTFRVASGRVVVSSCSRSMCTDQGQIEWVPPRHGPGKGCVVVCDAHMGSDFQPYSVRCIYKRYIERREEKRREEKRREEKNTRIFG